MSEQYRFVIETEIICVGSYRAAFEEALVIGQTIFDNLPGEAEVVVLDGDDTSFHGVPNGVYCEGCRGHVIPGIRWPTESNGDSSRSWVERCDVCERYASDYEAADRIVEDYASTEEAIAFGVAIPDGAEREQAWVEVHIVTANLEAERN